MRIGILTGGGDVPGLNACIRSVVLNADDLGWSVTGFRRGWEGVMGIDPADPASVAAHSLSLDREAVMRRLQMMAKALGLDLRPEVEYCGSKVLLISNHRMAPFVRFRRSLASAFYDFRTGT